jgi:cyclopropane-fatty-acyl-phospholipid synthase
VVRDSTELGVREVKDIGNHYPRTLQLWRERFLANWEAIAPLGFDERFRRMWEYYLTYCQAGFETGVISNVVLTLARAPHVGDRELRGAG